MGIEIGTGRHFPAPMARQAAPSGSVPAVSPINGNTGQDLGGDGVFHPDGSVNLSRILFVTDKNGVWHKITTMCELERIWREMTPQQLADWKTRYRFAPVNNATGIRDYTGSSWDL